MTEQTTPKTPEHKSLMAALLAVQAEAPKLQKDKINPAFRSKYLSLDGLMEQIMPVLNKHGLVWVTMPVSRPEGAVLHYRLIHVGTDQEIAGEIALPIDKQNAQGLGSAITYMRRYTVLAVLGLVADEDDDGNKASRPARNGGSRVTASPVEATERVASAKQRGLINGKAGEKSIPPSDLANIVLAATESEIRDFESQQSAEEWLRRAMDRLPARCVDPILEAIERVDAESVPV